MTLLKLGFMVKFGLGLGTTPGIRGEGGKSPTLIVAFIVPHTVSVPLLSSQQRQPSAGEWFSISLAISEVGLIELRG